MAKVNPIRFSTQYTDDETDLVCYLHRYYNPNTGRWLSRDPIEERGGLNLYALLSNAAPNDYDVLGLLHGGEIIRMGEACTARVVFYKPFSTSPFGEMKKPESQVGALLRIEMDCDCSGCGCYKWRQHYTEREDDRITKRDVLDNSGRKSEWYQGGEPETAACTYPFYDFSRQEPPYEMVFTSMGSTVERVTVDFRLELVKLQNCGASSGGTVVGSIRWGYWYTKDANGLLNAR